ncbi:MAG: Smr/MutS family protein [Longimicrobiales bacterium]
MEGSPLSIGEVLAAYPVARLDLHGCSAAEAERRVLNFVRTHAAASPGDVVEIVTGKGVRSVGPAVLPGLVRELLQGELKPSVAEWAGMPGGGAVKVRLRKRRGRVRGP